MWFHSTNSSSYTVLQCFKSHLYGFDWTVCCLHTLFGSHFSCCIIHAFLHMVFKQLSVLLPQLVWKCVFQMLMCVTSIFKKCDRNIKCEWMCRNTHEVGKLSGTPLLGRSLFWTKIRTAVSRTKNHFIYWWVGGSIHWTFLGAQAFACSSANIQNRLHKP